MPMDGGDSEHTLAEFARLGIYVKPLAERLQREGAEAFVKSWQKLMQRIDEKGTALPRKAG